MGDCNENSLIEYMVQIINESGRDTKFIETIVHHLNVVKEYLSNKENRFQVRQDLLDVLLSKMFISLKILPRSRYKCQVDENFEWPLIPDEAFSRKEKLPEVKKEPSENGLPESSLNPTANSDSITLTDKLNAHPRFHNPLLFNSILERYGYDVKRVSSCYSGFDNLRCPEELTGKALLKSAKDNDLTICINTALEESNKGNIPGALDALQSALEIDDKCAKAYEIRGKIYADLSKSKLSEKALWNYEKAFNLDSSNPVIQKELSKALSKAAIKFYKKHNYREAAVAAENALTLDKDNVSASKLLNYFKEKHPECLEGLKNTENQISLGSEVQTVTNQISSLLLVKVKTEPVDSQLNETVK